MSQGEENYNRYLQQRQELINSQYTQFDSFDRNMLTLSAGSFGVTFAFISNIVKAERVHAEFLILGWSAFSVSILVILLSFLISQLAYKKEIDELDKDFKEHYENPSDNANKLGAAVTVLNWIAMITFIAGVIFILIFVCLNL